MTKTHNKQKVRLFPLPHLYSHISSSTLRETFPITNVWFHLLPSSLDLCHQNVPTFSRFCTIKFVQLNAKIDFEFQPFSRHHHALTQPIRWMRSSVLTHFLVFLLFSACVPINFFSEHKCLITVNTIW